MKLCVLGSGSRGNAILLQGGSTRVLVDAGFAPRVLAERLRRISVDPASITAAVVTHEHTDHAKGAAAGASRWGWRIFATAGTCGACVSLSGPAVETVGSSMSFAIDDLEFTAVSTSHDADDPVALVATDKTSGCRVGIVYDLGVVTEQVQRSIEGVDVLVIESNHDGDMLRNGPYPRVLQRRIASRHGHLSNRAAAFAAARCAHKGLAHVVLAHLSETNNTPRLALESMRTSLARTVFRGNIAAAMQDSPSATITARGTAAFEAVQLTLAV